MEIYSLASGSSGNAYIIAHQGRALLLDAGLSGKRTFAAMAAVGVNPGSVTAILITHEHNDHIAGAGIISRRLGIPLYMTAGTWQGAKGALGKLAEDKILLINARDRFYLNDIEVTAMPVFHDSQEPVNYIFDTGRHKAVILTDTGCVTEEMLAVMANCDAMVLETNHDSEMLQRGPYPWHLKKRVASDRGHLSNLQAARVLARLVARGKITQAYLGHLSAVNNSREAAIAAVSKYLVAQGMASEPVLDSLTALPRHSPGPVLQVK